MKRRPPQGHVLGPACRRCGSTERFASDGKCVTCKRRRVKVYDFGRRYNISHEQYLDMEEAQGHRCAICHSPAGKRKLHTDHDHVTGRVRALLCTTCNTGLGMFRHDLHLLEEAGKYLVYHSALARTDQPS